MAKEIPRSPPRCSTTAACCSLLCKHGGVCGGHVECGGIHEGCSLIKAQLTLSHLRLRRWFSSFHMADKGQHAPLLPMAEMEKTISPGYTLGHLGLDVKRSPSLSSGVPLNERNQTGRHRCSRSQHLSQLSTTVRNCRAATTPIIDELEPEARAQARGFQFSRAGFLLKTSRTGSCV